MSDQPIPQTPGPAEAPKPKSLKIDICGMYDKEWNVCRHRKRLTLSGSAEEMANRILSMLKLGQAKAVEIAVPKEAARKKVEEWGLQWSAEDWQFFEELEIDTKVTITLEWDYHHQRWEVEFRWFITSEETPDYWERCEYDKVRQYLTQIITLAAEV